VVTSCWLSFSSCWVRIRGLDWCKFESELMNSGDVMIVDGFGSLWVRSETDSVWCCLLEKICVHMFMRDSYEFLDFSVFWSIIFGERRKESVYAAFLTRFDSFSFFFLLLQCINTIYIWKVGFLCRWEKKTKLPLMGSDTKGLDLTWTQRPFEIIDK